MDDSVDAGPGICGSGLSKHGAMCGGDDSHRSLEQVENVHLVVLCGCLDGWQGMAHFDVAC